MVDILKAAYSNAFLLLAHSGVGDIITPFAIYRSVLPLLLLYSPQYSRDPVDIWYNH